MSARIGLPQSGCLKETAIGGIVRSFAAITFQPNELVAPIHDRMPVILPPIAWLTWLGKEAASEEELRRC